MANYQRRRKRLTKFFGNDETTNNRSDKNFMRPVATIALAKKCRPTPNTVNNGGKAYRRMEVYKVLKPTVPTARPTGNKR